MRSGRLKDRVTIQAISSSYDVMGQQVQTWVDSSTRSCSIEPINGKEYFAAQGENTTHNVRIRFRHEKGLLSTSKRLINRRVSPNTIYDIQSVIDPGNEGVELICMVIERG